MGEINYGYWGSRFLKIIEEVKKILNDNKLKDSEKIRIIKVFLDVWL